MNHIALITDDGYLLPTLVTAKSILENNSNVLIHICTFGLNSENNILVNSFIQENGNIEINVFDKKLFDDKLSKVNQKSHVTTVALIKLELANYFSDIDKMLYLDSDIIVEKNINALFETDIEGYYIAACFEFWRYIYSYIYKFGKKDKEFYFNSGVMLLNLKELRKNKIPEQLWNYKLYSCKTTLMDQECLNAVCLSKTKPIPIIYNFNPIFINSSYINAINYVYGTNNSSIDELLSQVAIFHYVGKHDKPWVFSSARKQEIWNYYYKQINCLPVIELKEYIPEKKSKCERIKEIVHDVGVKGLVSYVMYRKVK